QNRIFRAYPGVPYVIRAAVMGGSFPYTFSLSKAPAGMTVDARTGEVSWPNPTADATPTITVVDGALTQISATWTIAVTTAGFHFVDAVNGQSAGAGGLGTRAQPWRTIADMRANAGPGGIVYFRAGTYTPAGLPTTGTTDPPETRVEFQHTSHPVIWIGYPGDARPVIDFGHTAGATSTPRFRIGSLNVYVDGIETTRSHIMAFQVTTNPNGQGATFRRCSMHDGGPGINGSNAAFIMSVRTGGHGFLGVGMTVMDNEFSGFTDMVALKSYDQDRLLVADNVIHDNARVTGLDAAIAIKGDHGRWEVRGNRIHDVLDAGIGGNMHTAQQGEIRFNYVRSSEVALAINQDGLSGPIYVSRNTLVGRVWVRNTDTADGPFTFENNVIVSSDVGTPPQSRIYHENVTDPARVVLSDNLTGAPGDGIVDANGDLTPAYADRRATHGR
ncbi:MAG: right-handed parallel beta-helix repeat-containing protein, partial [Planctomycetes bacterium]|nr:right-handed parallel beta-helix repeat-containing protein [Planctomycetota bacterium]